MKKTLGGIMVVFLLAGTYLAGTYAMTCSEGNDSIWLAGELFGFTRNDEFHFSLSEKDRVSILSDLKKRTTTHSLSPPTIKSSLMPELMLYRDNGELLRIKCIFFTNEDIVVIVIKSSKSKEISSFATTRIKSPVFQSFLNVVKKIQAKSSFYRITGVAGLNHSLNPADSDTFGSKD